MDGRLIWFFFFSSLRCREDVGWDYPESVSSLQDT